MYNVEAIITEEATPIEGNITLKINEDDNFYLVSLMECSKLFEYTFYGVDNNGDNVRVDISNCAVTIDIVDENGLFLKCGRRYYYEDLTAEMDDED